MREQPSRLRKSFVCTPKVHSFTCLGKGENIPAGCSASRSALSRYLRGGWDDPHCARLPNSSFLIQKGSLVDPRMRASNEHIPIVRVPRAGGRPGYPTSLFQHPDRLTRDRPYARRSIRSRMPRKHTVRQVFSTLDSSVWRFVGFLPEEDLVEIEGVAPTWFPLLLRRQSTSHSPT